MLDRSRLEEKVMRVAGISYKEVSNMGTDNLKRILAARREESRERVNTWRSNQKNT